jgi:predicted glycosyltransferase
MPSVEAPTRRVILYSHDAMGIGHIRRNLLVARALAERNRAQVLLICGVAEAGSFEFPGGVDCLTLPSLKKDADARYVPRRLAIDVQRLVKLRTQTIRSAVEAFEPDMMIVDKVPRGVASELLPTLQDLREAGQARVVLGLRDILDDPQVVRREWQRDGADDVINQHYDAIWIYGDPAVYNAVSEYGFVPSVARKVRFTGYLRRSPQSSCDDCGIQLNLDGRRSVACLVGGGEDGAPLALAFARAQLPADTTGLIITGPFMPHEVAAELRQLAANRGGRLRVIDFVRDPLPLLLRVDRIVTMGGYNSVSEAICARKPTLVVPRVRPRQEQLIRAERLARMNVVDVLHPDQLDPDAITEWLTEDQPAQPATDAIDFDGLERIPQFAQQLLALQRRPTYAAV